MKKIFCLLLMIFISTASVYAKDINKHSIKYNGEKYYLLYSTENKESGGYLNEYYKLGENYFNWSEMIAVHSFPSEYSPFNQVKLFKDYLAKKNCSSTITFDDKKSAALIDFVMINDKNVPNILEFNVFKYQKVQNGGSAAVQYVKRQTATTALQVKTAKNDFEKGRNNALKEVKAYKIPPVIKIEYDKYKLVNNTAGSSKEPEKEEIKALPASAEKTAETISEIAAENSENEIINNDNITVKTNNESVIAKTEEDEEISLDSAPSEIELIQKQPGYDRDIYPVKSKKKSKNEVVIQKEEYAPTPESKTVDIKKTKVKKEKKVKGKKEETYQVINSKEDFYAKPVKRKNISPRKAAKQKAKESAKKLKESL